jgi:hypothetical protein
MNMVTEVVADGKVLLFWMASPNCSTGDGMIFLGSVIGHGHPRVIHHYKNEVQQLLFQIRTHVSFGRPRTPRQCNFVLT